MYNSVRSFEVPVWNFKGRMSTGIERDTYELAIELCKDYRKRGYGYRALSLLMQYAFERTGNSLYRVRIRPDNYDSQALFKNWVHMKPESVIICLEERC